MITYLDETGNLTKGENTYFIVGTFTVKDSQKLENSFKSWQKNKFPKRIRVQPEVKFNDAHISDILRIKTINYLMKQDIKIFYTFLNKNNIPEHYRGKKGIIQTGMLYTEVVADTLELYIPFTQNEFRVIRDRRILKGVTLSEFNKYLTNRLLPKLPAKTLLHIEAKDSTASPHIQIADWICGALGRYYEKKKQGDEFYNILKNNIKKEKELFSDYWGEKWNK